MNWEVLLDRSFVFVLGVIFGLILGYARWARRDADRALKMVLDLEHEIHDDKEHKSDG